MNNNKTEKVRLRYNIVTIFVYAIGIILLIQLFNLQIVHGEEYREQSNTRLIRESTLKAARGNILDQTGNKLATTTLGYSLELYKTKIDTQTLNETLLRVAQILELNGDAYVDTLPIKVEPFEFSINEESQAKWKKENNIEENKTAEECFYILKDKYKITNENIQEARKIMTLRYYISQNGYSSTRSVELASGLTEVSIAQINEQSSYFPGVNITTKPMRSYPFSNLASHILGYIGKISSEEYEEKKDTYTQNDVIGKTGIEYIFEDYLKGIDGSKQIAMAVDGTITDEYVAKEAVSGSDVILTIDANLQQVTENALKTSIADIEKEENIEIPGAAAVVMKVQTGEILAMASYPDFNPSDFSGTLTTEKWDYYTNEDTSSYAKKHPFVNRAISSTLSPGSTYKMVTAIMGLETGAISLTEKINDVGIYRYYSDYQPKCWLYASYGMGHGYLNVTEAIIRSCNYFFYEVGNRAGIQNLVKYSKALGLGKKTGVELLGEEKGQVAGPETSKALGKDWNEGNTLSAAIGQENNSFTPIQMAKYTSILANGGKDIDVTILKSVVDCNGNEIPKEELEQYLKKYIGEEEKSEEVTFKQENLNAILEGMKGVTTESGGTAYSIFKGFNIEVGGKTGSAQTERKDKNGKEITNAWFVGFAPFDKPEIAIAIMIENGQHGSNSAIPARDIIAEYFGMNASKVTEDMSAKPVVQLQN